MNIIHDMEAGREDGGGNVWGRRKGEGVYLGGAGCRACDYDQGAMDKLIGVDDDDEFAIYVAPMGKLPE